MRRSEKYPETKWFHLHNENPKNRYTDDCYVRSIATATEVNYHTVLNNLVDVSIRTGYSVNSKQCIATLLKECGYEINKQIKTSEGKKLTGKQFCETHTSGRYIIFIGGHHITAVINGKIWDTWDCTDKCVGNFWKISD